MQGDLTLEDFKKNYPYIPSTIWDHPVEQGEIKIKSEFNQT